MRSNYARVLPLARRATIAGLEPGKDLRNLCCLMLDIGYAGTAPIGDHVVRLTASGADTVVEIDPDGVGRGTAADLMLLRGVVRSGLDPSTDLLFQRRPRVKRDDPGSHRSAACPHLSRRAGAGRLCDIVRHAAAGAGA